VVVVTLVGVGVAAVIKRYGVFGIEPDCLSVVHNGAVVVALGVVGQAAVVEHIGVFRIEPNRLGVVRNRAVVLALVRKGEAAVIERYGKFRIQPDRSGVVGNGVIVVAFCSIGDAAVDERWCVFWIAPNQHTTGIDSLVGRPIPTNRPVVGCIGDADRNKTQKSAKQNGGEAPRAWHPLADGQSCLVREHWTYLRIM
jgi:hypothetical protein